MGIAQTRRTGFASAKDFNGDQGLAIYTRIVGCQLEMRDKFRSEEQEERVVLYLDPYLGRSGVEFVLNATNTDNLIAVMGVPDPDPQDCVGVDIVLYIEPTSMGMGLRLRAPSENEAEKIPAAGKQGVFYRTPGSVPVVPVAAPPVDDEIAF